MVVIRVLRAAVGAAILASASTTPIASGTPVLPSPLANLDSYAVISPANYEAMDGRWYAFAGPAGVTCVVNTTNSSYGCSGALPGAPGRANLVSAAAVGPPAFTTTEQPIFAAAGDVKALPPNTRLSFGDISCGADAEGTVACVNSRDKVGFSVSAVSTFISGLGASGVGRIFTGDYCTGDLSQWSQVHNITAGGGSTPGSMTWPQYRELYGTYPVAVVREDTGCGYAARFEIRPGDSGDAPERSQVAGGSSPINVTRWEAFSVKFDPTFPLNGGADYGWAITHGWPDASGLNWGFQVTPEQNGWARDGATPAGYWSLFYRDNNGPPTGGFIRLLDVPLDRGKWIDVKMHIGWYASAAGFVQVWINGKRQTLRYRSWLSEDCADTFSGQTVWNNATGTFYHKQGLYRQDRVGYPLGVVYHANYRTATDEASL